MAVQRLAHRGKARPGGWEQPPLPLAGRPFTVQPLGSLQPARSDAAELQEQLARLIGMIELFSLAAERSSGEALFTEELLETLRPLLGLAARLRVSLEDAEAATWGR